VIADRVSSTTYLLVGIPAPYYRDIVKQPVMTYFYGVTDHGRTNQVIEKLKKLGVEFTIEWARDIAEAVFGAIEGTITAAKEVRQYLERLAAAYAKPNKAMRWPTPWLLILNPYYKMITAEVNYPIRGKRTRHKVCVGNTSDIRPGKSKRSITANFVHSCDAALMHAVALAAKAECIEMIPIHDCWACLAPDAERLNEIIRDRMIWLHTEFDWLGEAHKMARQELPDADLPESPARGDYDPNSSENPISIFPDNVGAHL
jgi:DNA-directed RNA polymerase